MLPKKELAAQYNELKQTIIPELQPDRLKVNGINPPTDEYNILKALDVDYAGYELLRAIEGRVEKVIINGCELEVEVNGEKHQSNLGLAKDNLEITAQGLNQLLPIIKTLPANFQRIFWQLIPSVFFSGYYAGGHDYLIATERHVNNGFKNQVLHPQSGGKAKSAKADPLRELVNDMAKAITDEPTLGKIKKAVLARSIHNVIMGFSNIGNNKSIPALLQFTERHPTSETINRWLGNLKIDNTNLKLPVSDGKIIQILNEKFTESTIEQYLNKFK